MCAEAGSEVYFKMTQDMMMNKEIFCKDQKPGITPLPPPKKKQPCKLKTALNKIIKVLHCTEECINFKHKRSLCIRELITPLIKSILNVLLGMCTLTLEDALMFTYLIVLFIITAKISNKSKSILLDSICLSSNRVRAE